jgi:hypothetical protein
MEKLINEIIKNFLDIFSGPCIFFMFCGLVFGVFFVITRAYEHYRDVLWMRWYKVDTCRHVKYRTFCTSGFFLSVLSFIVLLWGLCSFNPSRHGIWELVWLLNLNAIFIFWVGMKPTGKCGHWCIK